jgi:hypothetical protein
MAAQIGLVDGTVINTERGSDFREVARNVTGENWGEVRTAEGELYLVRPEKVAWVRLVPEKD